MNKTMLIGRITRKPELKYTTSNKAVTSFSVAVDTGYGENKKTDFIKIQAWNKSAENICNYLDKGNQIAIDGSIRTSTYEDKNGDKRIDTFVVANQVIFLGSSKKEEKVETSQRRDVIEDDPFADFGDSVTIDDDFLE